MQKVLEDHVSDIRTAGYKATAPRISVLSFLASSKRPLSVREIAHVLQKKGINEVTVYRIVEAFTLSGLISQSDLGRGRVYEYARKSDHHHLTCTSCEKVVDIAGCDFSQLARKALKQTRAFAEVKSHSFELFGICKQCAYSA